MRSLSAGRPAAALVSFVLAAGAALAGETPQPAAPVPVVFQLNDAYEKDKVLPGVQVGVARGPEGDYDEVGTTDKNGRYAVSLVPGLYHVTYKLPGFVPIERTETLVRSAGQVVTTTLSMNLEAVGLTGKRRIAVVLNWGSDPAQVKDADSHLACGCAAGQEHVYFGNKEVRLDGGELTLDVDDMDWGGPETISLLEPPAGTYWYWVYDYSGSVTAKLGASDVVVRVLDGDRIAGEFRAPPEAAGRLWRPFKQLAVDRLGDVQLVRFTAEELARGEALSLPSEASAVLSELSHTEGGAGGANLLVGILILAVLGVGVFFFFRVVLAAFRRRR
jgi:hypothetical protein